MTIRPLTEIPEFEQCVRLQREIWGMADIDLIPSRSYAIQHHIGGLVLGAFDSDGLWYAHDGIDSLHFRLRDVLHQSEHHRGSGHDRGFQPDADYQ